MSFQNGAGREAVRIKEFRPYADAADIGLGEAFVGLPSQHTIIWQSDTEFTMYVHDGFTPGGHPIQGSGGGGGSAHTATVVSQQDGIIVTSTGAPDAPRYDVAARVSGQAGNQLVLNAGTGPTGGLYVPAPVIPEIPDPVTVSAGNTGITVLQTGDDYAVGARVSPAADNQLSLTPTGLYVPPPETVAPGETKDVVSGSPGIGVEETATEFRVSVVLDPFEGNRLTESISGLFVPPEPPYVQALSADAGNVLEARPDGLYVNAPLIQQPVSAANLTTLTPAMVNQYITVDANSTTVAINGSLSGFAVGDEICLTRLAGPFILMFSNTGSVVNGTDSPCSFEVGPLPDGVVLKRISATAWHLLGDAVPQPIV